MSSILINKASCAIRKACGKGNGDGAFEHVLIEKETGITATDGTIIARISLPDFSDAHTLDEQGKGVKKKILHKSNIDIIDKMLADGDPNDPNSAALITSDGALRIKGDNIIKLGVESAQGKLPFANIEFPDVDEHIPDRGRAGSNTVRVGVEKMSRILAIAKAASIDELDIEFPENDGDAIRFDGINSVSQMFLGVVMPVTEVVADESGTVAEGQETLC